MFKVDFREGKAVEWSRKDGEVRRNEEEYYPTIYLHGEDLKQVRAEIARDGRVRATCLTGKKLELRGEEKEVLRVDAKDVRDLRDVAHRLKKMDRTGHRLFNVDLTPQFRYCLETGTPPSTGGLEELEVEIPRKGLASEDLSGLKIGGEEAGSGEEAVQMVIDGLDREPDVIRVNSSRLIPLLKERLAGEGEVLGREEGVEKLAGENSYESFGRVGHSPARYTVPGRVVLDSSNSFFLGRTGIPGMKYLVEESWKPLQEIGWASIGNVLTAIEIREATDRGVLVPWKKWEPERFKDLSQLHEADRGGFIFSPETGLHRDVFEVDFSSLYPNIMVEKNISPDTLMCDCHPDRQPVPGLDYSVCEKDGFLRSVLKPLIDHRDRVKQELRERDDPELESVSDAIKWVLVSCFGYQGYRNSKFGRIECHEAINAHARDMLLDAKQEFEENGWEVVHGIIDSAWVKDRDSSVDVEEICRTVSERVDVELEHEARYDWICFVPRKDSEAGALNRYFGRKKSGEYKFRGIEARQSSSPEFVRDAQREMIEALGEKPRSGDVIQVMRQKIEELENGVDPGLLTIRKNISRERQAYSQYTRTVAALERAEQRGLEYRPGEKIGFVVADDTERSPDRVRLENENTRRYDTGFYTGKVREAARTVLSGLGAEIPGRGPQTSLNAPGPG
ncbi:MAG: type B DNA-directed DNA polymerase [Candidatus Nanohaloarchaea archaeon]